ncbi:lasso peptide biosynthesis B2 protein [Sphingobium sp. EM0848]|uniref:lasso peptide biosynthesis B2 protein n=1 Tax=Sphingobium sp. EM0848 TaxID=2743473 RepID=UPI00159C32AD|nr:lasso peptide biosynthesis B2 protein [Sphingobium sp. EM0848]
MTGYSLRDGLSFCRTEGRTIFLDLNADRYFGLRPALEQAFCSLIDADRIDDRQCDTLLEAGIIIRSPASSRPVPCPLAHPAEARLPLEKACPSPALVASALTRRLWWRARLRQLPFSRNIRVIEQRKHSVTQRGVPIDRLARLDQAYRRAAMILSARDQCLPTALSLASWLIALSIRPNLVLGVKLNPFQAHSWIEVDGMIMADDPDQVRPFSPIRII